MIRELLLEISHVMAPRLCHGCGRTLLPQEKVVCLECLLTMPRAEVSTCRTLMAPILELAPCPAGIASSWVRYTHDSAPGRLIRAVKYNGFPRAGRTLGTIFGRELLGRPELLINSQTQFPDVLLPIPLYWRRQLKRGFNQSEWIARGIAEVLGAEVWSNLIARQGHSTQTHKSGELRRQNVAHSFALEDAHSLDGHHVAIVDDIITTGATVTEAVLAIARSGATPASLGLLSLGLAGTQ